MILQRDMIDVVGTGFTVLDRLYADGDFTAEALGGSCGNVLVSLAMLHRQVAPVLALGLDEIGEQLLAEFEIAGADTRYIHRHPGRRSPVLRQELDTRSGQHSFSFTCRDTLEEFPRYQPIGRRGTMRRNAEQRGPCHHSVMREAADTGPTIAVSIGASHSSNRRLAGDRAASDHVPLFSPHGDGT